jgi:hypothetical protein
VVWPPPLSPVSDASAATAVAPAAAGSASGSEARNGGGEPSCTSTEAAAAAPLRPVIVFGEGVWGEARVAASASGRGRGEADEDSHRGRDTGKEHHAANGSQRGHARGPVPGGVTGSGGGHGEMQGDHPGGDVDTGAPPPPDPGSPALAAGRALWRRALWLAAHDPVLSTDKVRNGSEMHRQKASGVSRDDVMRCDVM